MLLFYRNSLKKIGQFVNISIWIALVGSYSGAYGKEKGINRGNVFACGDQSLIMHLSNFESRLKTLDIINPQFVSLNIGWENIIQKDGSYNYTAVDEALIRLKEKGYKVRLLFYLGHPANLPEEWQKETMRDQNGNESKRHPHHVNPQIIIWPTALSLWGEKSRPGFLKFVEETVKRYRDNPQIIQWQFHNGMNEGFYAEQTEYNKPQVFDYSIWSQNKFRWYLQHVKGYGLKDVSRRAGIDYKQWDEVEQPKPVIATGFQTDILNLNPFWADFIEYRAWSCLQQAEAVCKIIRKYDKDRTIMLFGNIFPYQALRQTYFLPDFVSLAKKYNAGVYVTSSEIPSMAMLSGPLVRKNNLPLSMECSRGFELPLKITLWLHEAINAEATIFNVFTERQPVEMTPALTHFLKIKPILKKVLSFPIKQRNVACNYSYLTGACLGSLLPGLYLNHNTQPIWSRQINTIVASRVLGYELEMITDKDADYSLNGFTGVLEPGSVVLPDNVINSIATFVKEGGRLVLFGDSGRYRFGAEKQTAHALVSILGYHTGNPWPAPEIKGHNGWLDPQFLSGIGNYNNRKTPPNPANLSPAASVKCTSKGGILGENFAFDLAYPYSIPQLVAMSGQNLKTEAVNQKGEPVMVSWSYGKGQVCLLAGYPDYRLENGAAVTDKLLAWLGAERRISSDSRSLYVIHKTKDGRHYYVLTNPSGSFVKSRTIFTDLPAGQQYTVVNESWNGEDYGIVRERADKKYALDLCFEPCEIKILLFTPLSGKSTKNNSGKTE